MVSAMAWGYMRIMGGTIVGGVVGFYVMHRLEISYKAKWDERLKKYEQDVKKKKSQTDRACGFLLSADAYVHDFCKFCSSPLPKINKKTIT